MANLKTLNLSSTHLKDLTQSEREEWICCPLNAFYQVIQCLFLINKLFLICIFQKKKKKKLHNDENWPHLHSCESCLSQLWVFGVKWKLKWEEASLPKSTEPTVINSQQSLPNTGPILSSTWSFFAFGAVRSSLQWLLIVNIFSPLNMIYLEPCAILNVN